MKMRFFLLVVVLLTSFVPQPVAAECTCYDTSGNPYPLSSADNTGETDEENTAACVELCEENFSENPELFDGRVSTEYADYSEGVTKAAQQQVDVQMETAAQSYYDDGSCTCYCGRENVGAAQIDGKFTTAMACKDKCEETGDRFVACANSVDEAPISNLRCFTSTECTAEGGLWSDDQPYDCDPNAHYCFPEPEPIQLSVHLGGTTQVLDIGTYINAAYTYLLGAGAIVAIVMVMIGGVQYMIGSSVGHADAAKKRIQNAVIGLILVMGAYLILNTVNPYLVQLKSIELPLIKSSIFVTGIGSCEDFAAKGYSLTSADGGTGCGDKGTVYRSPSGQQVGYECRYSSCAGSGTAGAACANVNGEYECMTCAASANLIKEGVPITSQMCASLQPDVVDPSDPMQLRCAYIRDADFNDAIYNQIGISLTSMIPLYGTWYALSGQAIDDSVANAMEAINNGTTGACGMIKIDCSSITSCADYEGVDVFLGYPEKDVGELDSIEGVFESICLENPCSEDKGGKVPKTDTCQVRTNGGVKYAFGVSTLDCYSAEQETRDAAANEERNDAIGDAFSGS